MRHAPASLVVAVLLAAPSLANAVTYYAYGSFCSRCQSQTPDNQFYDDGLHDDGAAGDGVFGAIITVDRPAGRYSWCASPDVGNRLCGWPSCWCTPADSYASLWTSGPGDVIHFRLGLATDPSWSGQWLSAGSHGIPPGTNLAVLFGPAQGWCAYPVAGAGYPAQLNGPYWERVVTIPTPGTYSMRFQTLESVPSVHGDPVWYSDEYNAMCCAYGDCPKWLSFTTTQPNSDVLFQFDWQNGRMRGVELGPTPTRKRTWGAVKSFYR